MGAIGGLLGTAGGVSGTGIKGPGAANISSPVTGGQVNAANAGVGQSLGDVNALIAALQGQGGIGNQSNILGQTTGLAGQVGALNGTGSMGTAMGNQQALNQQLGDLNGAGLLGNAASGQQALNSQLAGATGVGTQQQAISGLQSVLQGQQGTADLYHNLATGQGPNPAQAMLNQQTGQNVANQAALMAGQRGAGSNVGLMARQAAQQGAATQQQAVGQGATMQAQQQLQGLQGLGAQQQAMAQTNQALGGMGAGLVGQQQTGTNALGSLGMNTIGAQQTGLSQAYGQGQGAVGQQTGLLSNAAGIAQNQVGNLGAAVGQGVSGNISNAGQQMGALGNFNTNTVNSQGSINSANAGLAGAKISGQNDMIGGLMGGVAAAAMLAHGGPVQKMAEGGMPYPAPSGGGPLMPQPAAPLPGPVTQPPPGPVSSFGQFLAGGDTGQFLAKPVDQGTVEDTANKAPAYDPKGSDLKKGASKSGFAITQALMASKGGQVDLRSGGKVNAKTPNEKAVKKGDSYANDKINATLSEDEVVLPRSVTQSQDPVRSAADFVRKVMAKRGGK